jgi:LemA protein
MNNKYIKWLIFGGVILVLFFWIIGSYNGLVNKDVDVQKAWSNVETQYQRRSDLIVNIVKIAMKASKVENKILRDVIEARNNANSIKVDPTKLSEESINKFAMAQNQVKSSFNVVVEQYPDLKSIPQFAKIQDEIAGTENRVGTARTDFNAAVSDYNKSVRSFPSNIFAGIFGFQQKATFKADEGTDKAPNLDEVLDKE